MKTLLALVLITLSAQSAFSAETNYVCKPYKNMSDIITPEEAKLPATFSINVENSTGKAVIRIAANNQEFAVTDMPFSYNVANAKRFDRYAVEGFKNLLVEKTAVQMPTHLTAKLEWDVDWFHDIVGWYAYSCDQ